jgi:thymidylate kinase
MKGIIPDLTLLLMINPKDGMQRILATRTHEINRLDQEVDTFKNKVYQAYETILKDDEISQHVVKIDANRDLQTVFQDCYQVVKKLINEKYPQ